MKYLLPLVLILFSAPAFAEDFKTLESLNQAASEECVEQQDAMRREATSLYQKGHTQDCYEEVNGFLKSLRPRFTLAAMTLAVANDSMLKAQVSYHTSECLGDKLRAAASLADNLRLYAFAYGTFQKMEAEIVAFSASLDVSEE